ncbi:MAG: hypothetical protein IT365_19365 [Candidatus Hydrogenedentes bacterium]|nr:hypothetical protein [Candidatus Hydrogenedentota bacterium]
MECHVCEVRSSVGYCAECQQLLCETCGVPCDICGKLSCPEHVHETRSGKRLCKGCYDERRGKREQKKAAAAAKHDKPEGDAAVADDAEAEGEAMDEALAESAPIPIQPWQMSLYIAVAGLVIVLLMLVFPGLRRIPLGGTNYIPTTLVVMIFPILSCVWAGLGLYKDEYFRDRSKCFIGIGLSIAGAALAILAMVTDPAATAQSELEQFQNERQDLNQQELTDWREKAKEQFRQ